MSLFDTVTVEVLAADFQTKQLGEGMLTYRLTAAGELVAPCGLTIACHGLVHLLGNDGAEFMAIFTHGRLECQLHAEIPPHLHVKIPPLLQ